jgi:hypothetical protein
MATQVNKSPQSQLLGQVLDILFHITFHIHAFLLHIVLF